MMEKEHPANTNHCEFVYAVINNIPAIYRSADLRRFFSAFVETEGFNCFHFRHRPELQSTKSSTVHTDHSSSKTITKTDTNTFCCIVRLTENKFVECFRTYHQRNWQDSKGDSMHTKCLISRLNLSLLVGESSGTVSSSSVTESDSQDSAAGSSKTYQTRADQRRIPPDREEFKEEDLLKLPELRPPTVMPCGNVGTPTMHFLKLIRECRLPPSIIKKLQLDFPKSKGKGKYGSVPFNYHTESDVIYCVDSGDEEGFAVPNTRSAPKSRKSKLRTRKSESTVLSPNSTLRTQTQTESASTSKTVNQKEQPSEVSGRLPTEPEVVASETPQEKDETETDELVVESETPKEKDESEKEPAPDYRELRRRKKQEKRERRQLMAERIEEKMIEFERGGGSDSGDNDDDGCEEWERHEAMYDDVSNQGRNKDRLFEEEMEVVWEKGSSGLVFYTDAQYWEEKEGDFDEQTADDLDVDMSAYYEQGAGDMDIRDFLTIRQEQRRRRGLDSTDRFSAGIAKPATKGVKTTSASIGKFERHTKGVGRKILEKQGWTEGSGLGSTIKGIADAIDPEGQHPKDRKGLGYRGEKLVRYGVAAAKKRKAELEGARLISTIYDKPSKIDRVESLHRRNDLSYVKHRNRIN